MMNKFNENAIKEAAYYIWQNNGCPTGTSQSDWNLAIEQLSSSFLNNASSLLNKSSSKKSCSKTTKSSASKISTPKKTSTKTSKKSK